MPDAPSESVFSRIASLSKIAMETEGCVLSTPFLAACGQILPVVEKLGTGFALVRMDVNGNITRIQDRQATDPKEYQDLFAIARAEVSSGEAASSQSATKAILWLKRAMEFVAALLQLLCEDQNLTLAAATSNAYSDTLYVYHGWVTSAAFTVALKLVPSREAFFAKFELAADADLVAQMQTCLLAFKPMLARVHDFLVKGGLDDPARV